MAPTVHIGASGFTYDHWREVFYPRDVPQRRWLEFYAQHFDTVELNNTFYTLPRESTFEAWHDRTPKDFLFAVKLHRVVTHRYRLMHSQEWLEKFLQAAACLSGKLGPLLVQLPPRWKADPPRLDDFLAAVPGHVPGGKALRVAVEFRDANWLCDAVYAVLARHNAALVVHDLIADHPRELTADFAYLRYHGPGAAHDSNYSRRELADQADLIGKWQAKGLEVFAYFNNDAAGHAIVNARDLKSLVEGARPAQAA